jgi:endonuclease/exonuclease/phosphatase family metal-dependent hydrolase
MTVDYDISEPYGPLVTGRLRIITWNVWGRYGPWEARERAIATTLASHRPDLVVLVEAWRTADDDQARRLAAELGLGHHVFGCGATAGDALSGLAVLSAWPIGDPVEHRLEAPDGTGPENGEGAVLQAEIDGPNGPIQVFATALAWRLDHSGVRQRQVRELAGLVARAQSRRCPTVICGDFNADPSSDEIRLLTGHAEVPMPGLVCYDAWATAGSGGPGHTWSNANPWAAPALWPDRRIDYVLSAQPRRGGAGHPTSCRTIGTEAIDGVLPSDHYGLLAELRY